MSKEQRAKKIAERWIARGRLDIMKTAEKKGAAAVLALSASAPPPHARPPMHTTT